jgi:hypothetical protein
VGCFWRVDARETDGYLRRQLDAMELTGYIRRIRYCFVLQIAPLLGYFSSWKPSPTSQPSSWGVEQVKVIPIPHSRHDPEQTPSPEEPWPYVSSVRDAAEVQTVDASTNQDG